MHARAVQSLSFFAFAEECASIVLMLLPDVEAEFREGVLTFVRGRSIVLVTPHAIGCELTLRYDGIVVLRGRCTLDREDASEARADIIGFLCGAPVRTLSIWPRKGPKPQPQRLRTRAPRATSVNVWWHARDHWG